MKDTGTNKTKATVPLRLDEVVLGVYQRILLMTKQ